MKRVGVAGFLHESNTFLPVPTTYDLFASTSLTTGQALLDRWTGTHHEIGGILSGAKDHGLTVVPLYATYAVPSGSITSEAFERIAAELLQSISDALPFDGLLLALHGATSSEKFPDADGEILTRVAALLGPDVPVITTLDLHANVSHRMAKHTTAIVAYRSNPHLDQKQRGYDAAVMMSRLLAGEIKPVLALETPPLVIQISRQHTAFPPASGLYEDVEAVCQRPGILSASVAMGFYYADVEEMGASFIAVADGDSEAARDAARWMAGRAWTRREGFKSNLPNPGEAVRIANADNRFPAVLMDVGDNVGAGSPGDSTVLFAELYRQGVANGLVVLHDLEAVQSCLAAGPGAHIQLQVGGKSGPLHGAPVPIAGVVRTLSDGRFTETAVRHGGWGEYDQGITAVVETAEGHTVVLTSRRMAPMSLEQLLSLGIHPERKRILIVKGVVAPRAAYEPVAAQILLADTSGVTSDNPHHFAYQRRRRPLFPLEADARYGD